jgi:Thioesterase-like superfamily
MSLDTAFYTRDGERYVATPSTAGPWDTKLQHGGPVAALLASRIEKAAAREDARVAYFSLDFLGPVPIAALDVKVEAARPGKKIALWTASIASGARVSARANAWLLATSEGRNAPVRIDGDAPQSVPTNEVTSFFKAVPHFGHGDALEWRMTGGDFAELGPKTIWARMRIPLVEGEAPTPLARVLAMVDSANGISAELDVEKYLFVPVNLTATLERYPDAEWVGMHARTSLGSDGIGITRAHIFDERGMIGEALQTLYVEKR